MSKGLNKRIIFLGAWLLLLFPTINNTFSVLVPYLLEATSWSLSEITLGFSLYLLLFSLSGFFAWPLVERLGLRNSMLMAALLYGIGWIMSGRVQSLYAFYLFFGFFVGFAAALIYYVILMNTIRFFPESSGKVSGILLSASGISPFIMAPIFNFAYESFGVSKTLLVFGGLSSLAIAGLAFLQPRKLQPTVEASHQEGLSPKKVLFSKDFALLFFIMMTIAIAGNMIISVVTLIAEEQIGLVTSLAALSVSTYTLANFFGRLSFGGISDRLGILSALRLSFLLMAMAMLTLGWMSSHWVLLFFLNVFILGFAFSGPVVIFPNLTREAFGQRYASTNYAMLFLAYSVGALIGPRLASTIYERNSNFFQAYLIAAGLVLLGLLVISFYEKRRKFER